MICQCEDRPCCGCDSDVYQPYGQSPDYYDWEQGSGPQQDPKQFTNHFKNLPEPFPKMSEVGVIIQV